ncbi:putative methyltransferase DDB_G0268948 [Saccoglossus kowalevskii]|uniref:Methyltransferase DDB_G0268948-like n=1 Tax=Saccoglossus kowalevskii TaxID=10224 RepID=A0ABM0GJ93_SACKO|nr:PREDICTED: putative methyltransferase DDB_G0268948-like [Saccoglossus kowalevskii]
MVTPTKPDEFHDFFRGDAMTESYRKVRTSYSPELAKEMFDYLKKKPGTTKYAVDVGCGSGQSTFMLAPYFNSVLGVDISLDQIKVAEESEHIPSNVSFKVASCGDIPVQTGKVDLITAGTAIHWFDLKTFYPEVTRLLRPGGCLAIYSFQEIKVETGDANQTMKINNLIKKVEETVLDNRLDHWSISRSVQTGKFQDLELPFQECKRGVIVPIKKESTVQNIVGLLKSYSESKQYMRTHSGGAKIFDELESSIMGIIGNSGAAENALMTLVIPVFLVMSRKPEYCNDE